MCNQTMAAAPQGLHGAAQRAQIAAARSLEAAEVLMRFPASDDAMVAQFVSVANTEACVEFISAAQDLLCMKPEQISGAKGAGKGDGPTLDGKQLQQLQLQLDTLDKRGDVRRDLTQETGRCWSQTEVCTWRSPTKT